MPSSTETNMTSVDKVDGNDITAAERNAIRTDLKLGIRDNRLNADAATVTLDLSITNNHQVTLGGNRTLAFSNAVRGQHFKVKLIQDGSGNRTVTWPSGISWGGRTVPTLSTAVGSKDIFVFECTGTNTYDGVIAALNVG
jgi:hypothetical protein